MFGLDQPPAPRAVPLAGIHRSGLAQAAPCEKTPEGGMVCPDGTYHPPGCPIGSPATVSASAAPSKFPVVPVAIGGVLAVGAAIFALTR